MSTQTAAATVYMVMDVRLASTSRVILQRLLDVYVSYCFTVQPPLVHPAIAVHV